MSNGQRILSLVVSEDEPSDLSPAPRLWDGPFPLAAVARPNELPSFLAVVLGEEVVAAARVEAERRGVPGRLWIRLAVEADRQLDVARDLLGVPRDELIAWLDEASAAPAQVVGIGDAALLAYARTLRVGGRDEAIALASGDTELVVPVEWALAWTRAAWAAGMEIGDWVASRLAQAPTHAVRWEAAAAETGRYLGEWVLWAALSKSASARAHA